MTKQYHMTKKRITAFFLVLALLLGMVPAPTSFAAKKVSLSSKKMTIKVGKSKKLKLKNNKKKVSWKVVSGKNKIKLKAKKKTGVTIVAKKKGKAKVQAKVGKKKYTCKVTVQGKSSSGDDDEDTDDAQDSADPNATASGQPSGTADPGGNDPGQTQKPGGNNPGQTQQPGGNDPNQTQQPGGSDPNQTQQPGGSDPNQTQQPGGSDPAQTQQPGGSDPDQTQQPGGSDPDQTQQPEGSDPDQTQQPGGSDPTQTQQPGGSDPAQTQQPGGSDPVQPTEDPTINPGENIDLGDRTVFKIGSRELALGIHKEDVKKILGTVTREGKSPQGYDVIVQNPGGYDGYTLIYLKDDVVVSICAVGTTGKVSYGNNSSDTNYVKTGDNASTLSGKGWTGESWYAAKDGDSKKGEGAYEYTDDNATILAFVDFHRQIKNPAGDGVISANNVYCIQAYSKDVIDFKKMTNPKECSYDDEIVAEIEKETAELLIAYRTSCGFVATQYPTGQVLPLKTAEGLATVAKAHLKRFLPGSDKPPTGQSGDALKGPIIEQNNAEGQDATMQYGQITMAGCSDGIGFANFIIEQKEGVAYISTLSYSDQRTNGTWYSYCYQYMGVAAAGETGQYACMLIDLVDRWYDKDPKWYDDSDDEEDGWE